VQVEHPDRSASHLPAGCLAGFLPAAVAALYPIRQVAVHFADCEIGVNAGANGLSLMIFVWPLLTLAGTVVFGLVFAAVRRTTTGKAAALAAFGALLAMAIVAPYVVVPLAVPADYPTAC
jgi:hypothetical protein